MSLLKSSDNKELFIDCNCGCGSSVKFKIEPPENDDCFFMKTLSSNWYREQDGCFCILKKKLKRIWRIILNKDYCYSELCMNKDEFIAFKDYINQF